MNSVFSNYLKNLGKRYAQAEILPSCEKFIKIGMLEKTFQVTDFIFEGKPLSFYECLSGGFLSKRASKIDTSLLSLHKTLVEEIGIIQESYNILSIYLENLQEIFTAEKDEEIWNNILIDVAQKAKEEEKTSEIDEYIEKLSSMTIFAYETNGNCFMYNSQGLVYLYAPDHAYDELIQLPLWPKYTLYCIPQIKTFDDFTRILFDSLN